MIHSSRTHTPTDRNPTMLSVQMKLESFISNHSSTIPIAHKYERLTSFREDAKTILITFSELHSMSEHMLGYVSNVGNCFMKFSRGLKELTAGQGSAPSDTFEDISPLFRLILQYYKSFNVCFFKVLEDFEDYESQVGARFSEALTEFRTLRNEVQSNVELPYSTYKEVLEKVAKAKEVMEAALTKAESLLEEKQKNQTSMAYNLTYAKKTKEKEEKMLSQLLDSFYIYKTSCNQLEAQEAELVVVTNENNKSFLKFYETTLNLMVSVLSDLNGMFSRSFNAMCDLVKCKAEESGMIDTKQSLQNHELQLRRVLKKDSSYWLYTASEIENLPAEKLKVASDHMKNYYNASIKLFEHQRTEMTTLGHFLIEVWNSLAEFSKEFPTAKQAQHLSEACLRHFSVDFHQTFNGFLEVLDRVSTTLLQTSSYLKMFIFNEMDTIIKDQLESEKTFKTLIEAAFKTMSQQTNQEKNLSHTALTTLCAVQTKEITSYYQREDHRMEKLQRMLQEAHAYLVKSCLSPLGEQSKSFLSQLNSKHGRRKLQEQVRAIIQNSRRFDGMFNESIGDTDEMLDTSDEAPVGKKIRTYSSSSLVGDVERANINDLKMINTQNIKLRASAKAATLMPGSDGAVPRQAFKNKFGTSEHEIVIDSFSCIFSDSLICQGRLYLTNKRLGFQSPFNAKTVFGETVVMIPHSEIRYLERDKLLFGVSNILHIHTIHGKISFSSFINSEKVLNLIDDVLTKTANSLYEGIKDSKRDNEELPEQSDEEEEEKNELAAEEEEEKEDNADKKDTLKKKAKKRKAKMAQYRKAIAARRKAVLKEIPFKNSYENVIVDHNISNTTIQTVYRIIFIESPFSFNDCSYINFWEPTLKQSKCRDYNIGKWEPDLPNHLGDIKTLSQSHPLFQRVITGHTPLKISVPMCPKEIHYQEDGRLQILDQKEIWFTTKNTVINKVPMSDCFRFRQALVIKQVDETTVNLQLRWFIDFQKSTMFKGTIISSSTKESKDFADNVLLPYLKKLEELGQFRPTPEDVFKLEQDEDDIEEQDEDNEQEAYIEGLPGQAEEHEEEEKHNGLEESILSSSTVDKANKGMPKSGFASLNPFRRGPSKTANRSELGTYTTLKAKVVVIFVAVLLLYFGIRNSNC